MIKRRTVLIILSLFIIGLIFIHGTVAHAGTYADKVLSYSPVAYWKLDETSGITANDISGNSYNGTYNGVTLDQIDGSGATMGRAGLWDGINDSVTMPNELLAALDRNQHTIIAWARVFDSSVWSDSTNRTIFSISADSTNDGISEFYKSATANRITGRGWGGSITNNIHIDNSSADWFFIALVIDPTHATGYLGSTGFTPVSRGTWSAATTSGRIGFKTGWFKGYIQHVAVFNGSLSSTIIEDLANPNPPPTPTPSNTPLPSATFTPRSPELIATLQNGNQWELDYRISAGDIALSLLSLIMVGLLVFFIIHKMVRR